MRTPRGRVATPAAWRHLGLERPPAAAARRRRTARPRRADSRRRTTENVTVEVPDYDLPEEAIAQAPVEPRDAARLLVAARPGRGRRASPRRRPAGAARARRRARGQHLPGHPGPAPAAKATGGAAEVLLLGPVPGGRTRGPPGRRSVRPGRRLAPGTVARCRPATARSSRSGPGARADGMPPGAAPGRRPSVAVLPPSGRCRCRRTSTDALADPERYQTVYADAARLGGGADGRPAPHPRGARRAAGRRGSDGDGRSGRRARHLPAGDGGPGRGPRRCTRERYRVPAATLDACRRPAGWSRWARRRCGPWRSAPPTGRAGRRDRPVHPRRLTLRGGRRPPHQLPPAPLDPAAPARRLLRARAGGSCTPRPWPAGTGSCPSATPCSSAATTRPLRAVAAAPCDSRSSPATAAARAGTVHTARGSFATPCFMPVGTRGAVRTLSRRRPGGAGRRSCSPTPTT